MAAPTVADPNAGLAMFSNEGVDELIPEPAFDYRTHKLTADAAHNLVSSLTRAMVAIEDKTGRFKYQR